MRPSITETYSIPFDAPIGDVFRERRRQDGLWGTQNHDPLTWLGILAEEFGEVAKAINERDAEGYRKELVETAAVAVAAVEAYDRGYWREGTANAAVSD